MENPRGQTQENDEFNEKHEMAVMAVPIILFVTQNNIHNPPSSTT